MQEQLMLHLLRFSSWNSVSFGALNFSAKTRLKKMLKNRTKRFLYNFCTAHMLVLCIDHAFIYSGSCQCCRWLYQYERILDVQLGNAKKKGTFSFVQWTMFTFFHRTLCVEQVWMCGCVFVCSTLLFLFIFYHIFPSNHLGFRESIFIIAYFCYM